MATETVNVPLDGDKYYKADTEARRNGSTIIDEIRAFVDEWASDGDTSMTDQDRADAAAAEYAVAHSAGGRNISNAEMGRELGL